MDEEEKLIQFPINKKVSKKKLGNNKFDFQELFGTSKKKDHLAEKPKFVAGKVFKLEGLEDFPEEPPTEDEPQQNTPDDSFR